MIFGNETSKIGKKQVSGSNNGGIRGATAPRPVQKAFSQTSSQNNHQKVEVLCHSSLALTHLIETDKSLQVIACAVLTP